MARPKKNVTQEIDEFDSFMFDTSTNMTTDDGMDGLLDDISQIENEYLTEEEEQPQKKQRRKRRTKAEKEADEKMEHDVIAEFKASRSDRAWKKLQEKYWFGIKQFAYKFVKDYDLASDMTIETFIRAYKSIDQYDESKSLFSTWLWTICRNNCLYYLKMKARLPIVPTDISEIFDSTMVSSSHETRSEHYVYHDNELTALGTSEIERMLYDVSLNEMDKLPDTTRTVLEMKLLQNMKIREIADELHMTESNVKNYLYTGKDSLANIIKTSHSDLYEMFLDAKADEDQMMY